jgi:hypothetical protein
MLAHTIIIELYGRNARSRESILLPRQTLLPLSPPFWRVAAIITVQSHGPQQLFIRVPRFVKKSVDLSD